jgi:hypothetical protein
MIKDVIELWGDLLDADTEEAEHEIVRQWGKSIVDECAGNFEVDMEDNDENDPKGYGTHPVLVRQSILNVKEQIK